MVVWVRIYDLLSKQLVTEVLMAEAPQVGDVLIDLPEPHLDPPHPNWSDPWAVQRRQWVTRPDGDAALPYVLEVLAAPTDDIIRGDDNDDDGPTLVEPVMDEPPPDNLN